MQYCRGKGERSDTFLDKKKEYDKYATILFPGAYATLLGGGCGGSFLRSRYSLRSSIPRIALGAPTKPKTMLAIIPTSSICSSQHTIQLSYIERVHLHRKNLMQKPRTTLNKLIMLVVYGI